MELSLWKPATLDDARRIKGAEREEEKKKRKPPVELERTRESRKSRRWRKAGRKKEERRSKGSSGLVAIIVVVVVVVVVVVGRLFDWWLAIGKPITRPSECARRAESRPGPTLSFPCFRLLVYALYIPSQPPPPSHPRRLPSATAPTRPGNQPSVISLLTATR